MSFTFLPELPTYHQSFALLVLQFRISFYVAVFAFDGVNT